MELDLAVVLVLPPTMATRGAAAGTDASEAAQVQNEEDQQDKGQQSEDGDQGNLQGGQEGSGW